MSVRSLKSKVQRGREGHNQGISIGLPKLESVIDGLTQATYTLLFSQTGGGECINFCAYLLM